MNAVHPEASRQAVVEAALVLLEQMGLSPADLAAVPQARKPVPTFAEYVPVVSAAVSAGTRRGLPHWSRTRCPVMPRWGHGFAAFPRRYRRPVPEQRGHRGAVRPR